VIRYGSAVFGLAAVRRSRLLEVGGFDQTMPIVADWELWLRLVLTGSTIGLVNQPLARYRLSTTGLTANKVREAQGYVAALERALRHTQTGEDRRLVEESLGTHRRRALMIEAEAALRAGDGRARGLAARIVAGRHFELRSRTKALLAVAAPATAARFLARREVVTGRSRRTRSLPTLLPLVDALASSF
jgi:hypothetical protein